MESFKLIVDSVEGLRKLTDQFAEQEPIVIKRGKKEQVITVILILEEPNKNCCGRHFNFLLLSFKENKA